MMTVSANILLGPKRHTSVLSLPVPTGKPYDNSSHLIRIHHSGHSVCLTRLITHQRTVCFLWWECSNKGFTHQNFKPVCNVLWFQRRLQKKKPLPSNFLTILWHWKVRWENTEVLAGSQAVAGYRVTQEWGRWVCTTWTRANFSRVWLLDSSFFFCNKADHTCADSFPPNQHQT